MVTGAVVGAYGVGADCSTVVTVIKALHALVNVWGNTSTLSKCGHAECYPNTY